MFVVYLSPVNWDSIAQRPHFFADFLAEQSVDKILWVDPLPSRFPRYSDIRTKLIGVESKSIRKHDKIDVVKVGNIIPIEPLNKIYRIVNGKVISNFISDLKGRIQGQNAVLVVGKPSVLSLEIIDNIKFSKVIADVMDDYPHFFKGKSQKSVSKLLRQLLAKSDVTMFSSNGLLDTYGAMTKKAVLAMNACSASFYDEIKKIQSYGTNQSNEVVTYGYIGSVASWFDWDFIEKLATNRPDSQIVIVGPLYVKPDTLPDNVIVKPAIDHKAVPALIKTFTYGIIPFLVNELTESVDPVKYYEYTAAGIPVITSCFGEMKNRVNDKHAVTLEEHLAGVEPVIETPVLWKDRFNFLAEGYLC